MRFLSTLAYPLVRLLSWSTDCILFVLKVRHREDSIVTEREISLMIDEGTEAGLFHKSEKEMVSNVMRLDALRVGAIMTPRMEIDYLDIASPIEETRKRLIESTHSVIPVCRNGLDNVLGVIEAKDLMRRTLSGEELKLSAAIRQVKYIPKSLSSVQLLEEFRRSKISLALVVDEYGEVAGLATVKDVLEAIVGDMPTEEPWEEEPDAVQREDGSWLLDGMLSVEKFKQLLSVTELPESEDGNYHTIGGFVMEHLGRYPDLRIILNGAAFISRSSIWIETGSIKFWFLAWRGECESFLPVVDYVHIDQVASNRGCLMESPPLLGADRFRG